MTNISSENENKIVIDFLEASYISSLGNLSTKNQLKVIFDRDNTIHFYIISSIKNISNEKFLIGEFKDCIFNTDTISEDYLHILGKVLCETKNGKYIIDMNIFNDFSYSLQHIKHR